MFMVGFDKGLAMGSCADGGCGAWGAMGGEEARSRGGEAMADVGGMGGQGMDVIPGASHDACRCNDVYPPRELVEEKRTESFTLEERYSFRTSNHTNSLVSALEMDTSGDLLATGGIQKEINVYRTRSLAGAGVGGRDLENPEVRLKGPAKVSSLAWDGSTLGRMRSGDYDGTLLTWDVETGSIVNEGYSHDGRRIWSVRHRRNILNGSDAFITAGEDGTCSIWVGNGEDAVGKLRPIPETPGVKVCCADFVGRGDAPVCSMVLSDSTIQIFDLRYEGCVARLHAHDGPVSNVAVNGNLMATSSTDSTALLWDMEDYANPRLIRRFRGHRQLKNFVGLGVNSHGNVVCGSESGSLYVYNRNWEQPVVSASMQNLSVLPSSGMFTSAVCWHPTNEGLLFAGNSNGLVSAYCLSTGDEE